jgi:hypothetical protein
MVQRYTGNVARYLGIMMHCKRKFGCCSLRKSQSLGDTPAISTIASIQYSGRDVADVRKYTAKFEQITTRGSNLGVELRPSGWFILSTRRACHGQCSEVQIIL